MGNWTVKVVPCPSILSTSIVPPFSSTSVCTIDSPKPAPHCRRSRHSAALAAARLVHAVEALEDVGKVLDGIPGPEFATLI